MTISSEHWAVQIIADVYPLLTFQFPALPLLLLHPRLVLAGSKQRVGQQWGEHLAQSHIARHQPATGSYSELDTAVKSDTRRPLLILHTLGQHLTVIWVCFHCVFLSVLTKDDSSGLILELMSNPACCQLAFSYKWKFGFKLTNHTDKGVSQSTSHKS